MNETPTRPDSYRRHALAPGGAFPPHRIPDRRAPARRGRIPPKLYRVGEIVQYTGVSRQTIHNYTTMGLITESQRTAGGHRLYDESVFARLDAIADMKGRNRSLREIRGHFDHLDAEGPEPGPPEGPPGPDRTDTEATDAADGTARRG